ncbi:MAG: glycine cleavage system aminomethyltransferase GcvT [Candidatus Wallbacteria bacterium]|nr:glycine cleavage system aminomethyltransferase GcvT [Candidatus Wallbacteria bacterium]
MKPELHRTALHDRHSKAGARMVEFAGWSMPVQYSGILEEHRHVRTACGIFDLSHMGELYLSGPSATADLQRLVTNDVEKAAPGQCVYSPMCNEKGGVVDDLVAYRLEPDRWLLVVNASNHDKDLAWVKAHVGSATVVEDRSFETSLLALQGPAALEVLAPHVPALAALKNFRSRPANLAGRDVLLSRTGYTGEDGFEIYCDNSAAGLLWDLLASDARVRPIGLGARDTLRFEARLLLYGNDLDEQITPLEAGLDWTVKLDKADFIGREALLGQKKTGPARRLVGFRMTGRGVARHGYEIVADGKPIGQVASGTFSPTLEQNLGLGFVQSSYANPGARFAVRIRSQQVEAEVVKTPFYKRPAAK